jgi:hypothetical protein
LVSGLSVITMSKGPGTVERRIAELFIATRDRALSVGEIADHAFGLAGKPASRVQRLSATRAAHRVLRRVREADERARQLFDEAHRNTEAALGRRAIDDEYQDRLNADPAYLQAKKLRDFANQFGIWSRWTSEGRGKGQTYRLDSSEYWRATTGIDDHLYFHAPDVPVRVWAVSIEPAGITWVDAEVLRVTERFVTVQYAGEVARLDREDLWRWWAFYRGVRFVSSRTGRTAQSLDKLWQRRYGHTAGGVPPNMQMPLAEAMKLLSVPVNFTKEDIIVAFRLAAKKAHPDAGGSAELFRKLVEARDRLLKSIGTSAPPPTMPKFAPKGTHIVYRRASIGTQRRFSATRRIAQA